ncbi:hypothetical protein ACIRL0_28680 [Streptomyces sp. NPDC102365]|uniref:hypothetical protein n=1 Tax=Streptomyces sp. NPDC102365 TaxID=3366162 RepID=UPI0037FF51DB
MRDDSDADARAQALTQRLAEDGRLWQHTLHENTMLFSRGNLFLVGQSLFAVAYTTLLTSEQHLVAARVLAAFGLVLALTWLYVGHRHRLYYPLPNTASRRVLPLRHASGCGTVGG